VKRIKREKSEKKRRNLCEKVSENFEESFKGS
jgi:hypothetical protein